MLREQHFVDMSRHPKPIDPEWAAKVAEYIEKKGVTDLDAPGAPKRKIPRTDAQMRELEGIERAKAEKRAQAEHLAALARLEDGTAVLRQKNDKNEVLKKAKAIKSAKPKATKVAKPAKKVAKLATPAKETAKTTRPLTKKQLASRQKRHENQVRRAGMAETLKAGGAIYPIDWRGENLRAHQMQSYDLMMIGQKEGISIVRVNKVGTNNMKFIIDTFERCDIAEPISSLITSPDSAKLFEIIRSGQMLTINDIKENVVAGARAVAYLSRAYDIDIYSVVKSNKTVGWVMADAGELQVRIKNESEVSDLGDMLDAIDYLKVRKEVAARMPGATPDEILEAAYREFKRVAKDAGSTISEVLAVKEGQ